MHGHTPITSLNNQSKGQEQQTIPVAALADGAWLLVRGMRLWKKACAQRTCIFAATHQEFSSYNCKVSVRYLDEMMSLFQVASHRPLEINSVTAQDATQDKLIVVATLRLIADNRYEQASGQLGNFVKGPLNLSIIRVCVDIAARSKRNNCPSTKDPIWL